MASDQWREAGTSYTLTSSLQSERLPGLHGFPPQFELLFRRRSCSLLDVTKEAWEGQPLPLYDVVEYLQDTESKVIQVLPYSLGKHEASTSKTAESI